MFNECKAQEKASDADVESILTHKPIQSLSMPAKCLVACMFEKTGVVSKILEIQQTKSN